MMDGELAALTASGATTLVSLMVTDSWTHARELLRRFLSPSDPDGSALTNLDAARTRLLTAQSTGHPHESCGTVEQWDAYLQHLLEVGAISSHQLRTLLTSLQRLEGKEVRPTSVRNSISGGVQRGPVIQSGQITSLTLHPDPPQN
ncbi:hypothetical protein AB0F07_40475 [Streptomyces fructofermentans]|uniref:hypothetical protein n=1 Tax=Streptomyces fructofermentans TaxID=152141 RepID=UPI0033FAE40B